MRTESEISFERCDWVGLTDTRRYLLDNRWAKVQPLLQKDVRKFDAEIKQNLNQIAPLPQTSEAVE